MQPLVEASTAWGAPVRISGKLTTYEDMYAALEAVKENPNGEYTGIYPLADGRLGVSADVIQSGALLVGSLDKPVFYADMAGVKPVKIAGW